MVRNPLKSDKSVKENDSRVRITGMIRKTFHMFRSQANLEFICFIFPVNDFQRILRAVFLKSTYRVREAVRIYPEKPTVR